ncbi:MAG TPA: glycosyltransferase [Actinomycetota bacterium]|nr:glycosyltransferase [Actinomycetota bacterium]
MLPAPVASRFAVRNDPTPVLDDAGPAPSEAQPGCRIAVLSMHTSPLEQPGSGDSGGLNVYVRKVAAEMARRNVHSDIYTRRTSPDEPEVTTLAQGVRVISVTAGPQRPVHKDRLPRLVKRFAAEVERLSAGFGSYELVHAHYWLSGVAGIHLKRSWKIPMAVSFHTLARVKDGASPQDSLEPLFRKRGEDRVVRSADRVVAATPMERDQLVDLYGCDPARIMIVPPGVDLDLFHPDGREESRRRMGFGPHPTVVFVGRLQPLKGPHVALGALARLRHMVPDARLVIAGDESPRGTWGERLRLHLTARRLGVTRRTTFLEPLPHDQLPHLYRAADVVVIPSASESFGLVALEAAACGTPVVATAVGGLRRLVQDGQTGYLVTRRAAKPFAHALSRVLADREAAERLGSNAVMLASRFPWSATTRGLLETYASVMACRGVRAALTGVG